MYPQTLSLFWILQSVFSNSELSESVTQSGDRSATAADKGVGYYSKQVVRDVVQTWQLRSWQLYCISFFRIDGRAYCFGECWFWTNGNKQDVCVTMLCSKSILWRPWKWAWIQCVAVCSNATWIEYLYILRVQSWKVCWFLCILQVTLRRRFGNVSHECIALQTLSSLDHYWIKSLYYGDVFGKCDMSASDLSATCRMSTCAFLLRACSTLACSPPEPHPWCFGSTNTSPDMCGAW